MSTAARKWLVHDGNQLKICHDLDNPQLLSQKTALVLLSDREVEKVNVEGISNHTEFSNGTIENLEVIQDSFTACFSTDGLAEGFSRPAWQLPVVV